MSAQPGLGKKVAVTGASGYIASHLVKQLVERGYDVHATVRNLSDETKVSHLRSLFPTVKLFEADLLKEGSFEECFKDCEIIFHTASPFFFSCKDPEQDFLIPAVKGTENAISTALKTPTVKRIVLTSSVAAVRSAGKPADYVFSDKDWNDTATLENAPYPYSKLMAEKKAWELVGQADGKCDLIVINPVLVAGPTLSSRTDSQSVSVCIGLLNGQSKAAGGCPLLNFSVCDVRDVALAHIKAAEVAEAKGRYLVGTRAAVPLLDMCHILSKRFPDYPIPTQWFNNQTPPASIFLDNSRTVTELGIQLHEPEQTIVDMAESLIAQGVIPSPQSQAQ